MMEKSDEKINDSKIDHYKIEEPVPKYYWPSDGILQLVGYKYS